MKLAPISPDDLLHHLPPGQVRPRTQGGEGLATPKSKMEESFIINTFMQFVKHVYNITKTNGSIFQNQSNEITIFLTIAQNSRCIISSRQCCMYVF